MRMRTFVITLMTAALALPGYALAQTTATGPKATVLLRNGERVSGVLEDVERDVVYVRESLHDQRKLNLDEVALIDFVGGASGLPETELSVARGDSHLVLLRGGTSVQGTFVDIRGGEEGAAGQANALIFRTANGEERTIELDQVARVYLGNFPTAAAGQEAPGASTGGAQDAVRVPGNSAWVATPLFVQKGDRVVFNVTGQIQLSEDANDVAISAGSLTQRRAANAPLPQHLAGALIARVGNGEPFPIGNVTTPITMPASGQLYLGINDDDVNDNSGEFVVRMARQRGR